MLLTILFYSDLRLINIIVMTNLFHLTLTFWALASSVSGTTTESNSENPIIASNYNSQPQVEYQPQQQYNPSNSWYPQQQQQQPYYSSSYNPYNSYNPRFGGNVYYGQQQQQQQQQFNPYYQQPQQYYNSWQQQPSQQQYYPQWRQQWRQQSSWNNMPLQGGNYWDQQITQEKPEYSATGSVNPQESRVEQLHQEGNEYQPTENPNENLNNYDNGFVYGSPTWRKSYTPMAGGCFNRCRPSCGGRGQYYGCRPSCRSACNIRPSCGARAGTQYTGQTMVCGRSNFNGFNQGYWMNNGGMPQFTPNQVSNSYGVNGQFSSYSMQTSNDSDNESNNEEEEEEEDNN